MAQRRGFPEAHDGFVTLRVQLSLHEHRHAAVLAILRSSGARRANLLASVMHLLELGAAAHLNGGIAPAVPQASAVTARPAPPAAPAAAVNPLAQQGWSKDMVGGAFEFGTDMAAARPSAS